MYFFKKSYLKIVFTKENNLAEINQINFILSAEFIFTDFFKKRRQYTCSVLNFGKCQKNNVQDIFFFLRECAIVIKIVCLLIFVIS